VTRASCCDGVGRPTNRRCSLTRLHGSHRRAVARLRDLIFLRPGGLRVVLCGESVLINANRDLGFLIIASDGLGRYFRLTTYATSAFISSGDNSGVGMPPAFILAVGWRKSSVI
jgi:hypothetical protein